MVSPSNQAPTGGFRDAVSAGAPFDGLRHRDRDPVFWRPRLPAGLSALAIGVVRDPSGRLHILVSTVAGTGIVIQSSGALGFRPVFRLWR